MINEQKQQFNNIDYVKRIGAFQRHNCFTFLVTLLNFFYAHEVKTGKTV